MLKQVRTHNHSSSHPHNGKLRLHFRRLQNVAVCCSVLRHTCSAMAMASCASDTVSIGDDTNGHLMRMFRESRVVVDTCHEVVWDAH